MRRIRAGSLVAIMIVAGAAPARADATAFIGANTTPANRAVRGFAFGVGLLLVGFEFEYATTPRDDQASAPRILSRDSNSNRVRCTHPGRPG